jgi:2'-hydroxyisoflavone reductase
LGGSNFIGRNLIESLRKNKQYELTLFNRGVTNPDLFPELRLIRGDRNTNDVEKLFLEDWDYVIDLSCYYPNSLAAILKGISKSVKRYLFVSTCSVYDNGTNQSVMRDESAGILACTEEQKTDSSDLSYGSRKAECERILVQQSINHIILRPALVYGKYDKSDRLYYWLYQINKNQSLMIPGEGEGLFSMTYVHDLVQVIIDNIKEDANSSVYNIITNPQTSIAMLIESLAKLMKRTVEKKHVGVEFLLENKVAEWTDLPLWLNCDYFTYEHQKSRRELDFEPADFDQSLKETLAYFEGLNWPKPTYGMSDVIKDRLIQNYQTSS